MPISGAPPLYQKREEVTFCGTVQVALMPTVGILGKNLLSSAGIFKTHRRTRSRSKSK